jgi:hypothetical protein
MMHSILVLERLMMYIIDLTLVLQNLFWIQTLRNPDQPITRPWIKLAAAAYNESNVKAALHIKVKEFLSNQSNLLITGPDRVLLKIEELLHTYTLNSTEVLAKQNTLGMSSIKIPPVDEEWILPITPTHVVTSTLGLSANRSYEATASAIL